MQNIKLEFNQQGEKFIPFWKKCICAGRAAEGLREDWRNHLRTIQKEIGFEYIRFHGLFHEDMMVYHEDGDGKAYYNWQYIDKLFDYLFDANIHPIVELGFMPYSLSTAEAYIFWWKGNTSPPKDYDKWADLVRQFAIHCINRYGLDEVLQWYFEVWNEANGGFWTGTQEEYFKLYEYSVKALKSINKGLKVGGPASTAHSMEGVAPWVEDLIDFCEKNDQPLDFISTHPYPNGWPLDTDGNYKQIYKGKESLKTDLDWLRKTIDNSRFRNAETHLTEWNSSPSPRDRVHDTMFMAPFIIHNHLDNLGKIDSLGFWTFTDVFEEGKAGDTIFHGGFGLMNAQGLKKPAYYGYWFLSRLGCERLAQGENYFVSRKNGKIQVLLWNYCHYIKQFSEGDTSLLTDSDRYSIFEEKGDLCFSLSIGEMNGNYKVIEYNMDRETGSVFDIWLENGAIPNPTEEEMNILSKKTGPEGTISVVKDVKDFSQVFEVKPHGVRLIEIQKIY